LAHKEEHICSTNAISDGHSALKEKDKAPALMKLLVYWEEEKLTEEFSQYTKMPF
jgi:hypothetical protein